MQLLTPVSALVGSQGNTQIIGQQCYPVAQLKAAKNAPLHCQLGEDLRAICCSICWGLKSYVLCCTGLLGARGWKP